jgi:hypothetical protein
MAHPYAKFRQNKVQNARAGTMTKSYDDNLVEGAYAKNRADRPMRASGGKVKKATTVVNVITGGQQQPAPPQSMPMPPPGAMAPPPPPAAPPGPGPMGGLPPGAGPAPGAPPMPMRARGGGVKSKGMDVGTKVQHDSAKAVDIKNMNRPRVVTFASGGKVKSFRAYANGGTPKDVAPATKLPGGAGGGEGRLAKIKKY